MEKFSNPLAMLPPEAILERIWQELARATVDRHHEWRAPVLATIGLDGNPQARVVVLRQASKPAQTLTVFTDRRTPKVAELTAHPAGMLNFWSKRLSWQCRIALSFKVHTEGSDVNAAWSRMSRSAAAKDYLALVPPGSPIIGGHGATSDDAEDQQHHLALLTGQASTIDWLELGKMAHRRIIFTSDSIQEVVP